MKNAAVHQQKNTIKIETQHNLRPEPQKDSELKATLTLQREWRKTAARVSDE